MLIHLVGKFAFNQPRLALTSFVMVRTRFVILACQDLKQARLSHQSLLLER